MTALRDILLAQIERDGPMTVAQYMTACLHHPHHGYYSTRDPLGAAGDFTTAPEISQMFGELLGLCLAQCWLDQGAPERFVLAELGPGRGTLMVDFLRATRTVPGFHTALDLWLVEASPTLGQVQAQALSEFHPQITASVTDLPDAPLFLVANEFFDALPIRQFQRAEQGWHERMIGADDGILAWGLTPAREMVELKDRTEVTAGQIVETCAPATAISTEIGRRVAAHGGAALVVDYGGAESLGDTFQAVAHHAPTDPLAAPGDADLTAHVAFGPMAEAATPAVASELTSQGTFLARLGIAPRTEALARNLSGTKLDAHLAGAERLTAPDEMGDLFKVLGLTPPGAPPPPGLTPATEPRVAQ